MLIKLSTLERICTTYIPIFPRSHAGKVHDVAKAAFGENVQITPAGGAGFKVLKSFDINSINDSLFSKLM